MSSPPEHDTTDALFEPLTIGPLQLRNRVVMAPMTRRKAPDDCVPDDAIAAYYERRAAGGVGLIITEGTHVDGVHAPDSPNVPGLYTDAQRDGWARVVERVHGAGGAIACQLWHTGRHAMDPIAPSPIPAPKRGGGFKPTPRQMTDADIAQAQHAFAEAATRAKDAGFDAVEIHGAHGYLLDSFISEETNQRNDVYGGFFQQRLRFPMQVVRAVRRAVGPGYPVIYRFSQWKVEKAEAMNYPDPDTLSLFVSALREAGVDILHVSTRSATDAAFAGSNRTLAGWSRTLSGLPTIAVGSVSLSSGMDQGAPAVTDPGPAAALIDEGEADMLAVGRALIANPNWAHIVRAGQWQDLRPYDVAMLETLD
ncbi:MAG: 12-oxophytodienoate reductase [Planctomycetota bacterium]